MNASKYIFTIISFNILTILPSCNNDDFEYSGIKLSLPDNWQVTGVDSSEDAHTINCSARIEDISRTSIDKVSIDIYDPSLDTTGLGKKIRKYKENMAAYSPSLMAVRTSTFNGIPSLKFDFTVSLSPSMNAKGYNESFRLKDKTITITVVQNIDETLNDKTGLDQLLKSIRTNSE